MEYEFKECHICDKKLGSPPLCDICLYYRAIIGEINKLKSKQTLIEELLSSSSQ